MISPDYKELVTRSRRARGLSDRIQDDAVIERVAAMVRATSTTTPRPAARPDSEGYSHAEEAV